MTLPCPSAVEWCRWKEFDSSIHTVGFNFLGFINGNWSRPVIPRLQSLLGNRKFWSSALGHFFFRTSIYWDEYTWGNFEPEQQITFEIIEQASIREKIQLRSLRFENQAEMRLENQKVRQRDIWRLRKVFIRSPRAFLNWYDSAYMAYENSLPSHALCVVVKTRLHGVHVQQSGFALRFPLGSFCIFFSVQTGSDRCCRGMLHISRLFKCCRVALQKLPIRCTVPPK